MEDPHRVSSLDSNEKDAAKVEVAGVMAFLDDTKGATTQEDVKDVQAAAANLTLDEARQILADSLEQNSMDPNFPSALLERAQVAIDAKGLSDSAMQLLVEEILLEAALIDQSPYPEVRAVVSHLDDPTLPSSTFRVWFIGLFFTIVGTGINTPRYPAIGFGTSIIQVLAYPMAKSFELFPARWTFLNPGAFNPKEHMLITIMANTGLTGAYINYIIFVLRIPFWYNDQEKGTNPGFQILLAIATQCMGFSLAGLTRRFLVYPPAMRFFCIIFVFYFFWYPVSNIAFQAITYFNWTTWIAPNNEALALWTGNFNGFGLNPISTFDWAWATAFTNPTITPLWSTLNGAFGYYFFGMILAPAIYYTNTYHTGHLSFITNGEYIGHPLSSPDLMLPFKGVHDRFGHSYNVTKIMTHGVLDQAKYEAYSPAYLGAANIVLYGCFFAFYTSGIMHGILYHRQIITRGFKSFRNRKGGGRDMFTDVHNRLMAVYPEVPEWWFLLVFVVTLVMACVHAEIYETQLPIWGIFFCMAMSIFVVLPIGIITAVSNVEITFNVLAELVAGYALPGKPTYGVEVPLQAIQFAGDLNDWQLSGNIANICTPQAADRMFCYGPKTFFTASVIWGLIGPKRNYSVGGLYYATVYGFLVGALIPIVPYFLARRYPRSIWRYVHTPAMLGTVLNLSPYGGSWMMAQLWLALFFMGYVRRRYLPWWMKYNYVGTTALNAALALGAFFWFFVLQYKDVTPTWWGNTQPFNGCDGSSCSRLEMPEIGMPIAQLRSIVLASSNLAKTVEGNFYFPRDSLVGKYFKPSSAGTKTVCGWKGTAEYLDLEMSDGTSIKDVAWYYAEPKAQASEIKGHVALYKSKVTVSA
ncbi:hypothetical protein RQP46_009912 [Phenoliferia psychrophenolica]